jgi:hypothetical protein
MNIQWSIHTESENRTLCHHELLQQIHSGTLSIQDWIKHPEKELWSRIFTVEEIIDQLLLEYIKNDCCYGPITGKELKEYYQCSKIQKKTPVKVCGQELWHRYSMICNARSPKKQTRKSTPVPLPIMQETQPATVKKHWTISDIMILSFTAMSLATLLTCYCLFSS